MRVAILLALMLSLFASRARASQICGTMPNWGADSLDCTREDQAQPQNIVKARLYRGLRYSNTHPALIDSLPASNGLEVCFAGIDTTIAASYFMEAVNASNKASCWAAISFPRVVSVDHDDDPPPPAYGITTPWHDVGSRIVHEPLPSGKYWRFVNGVARDTTVRR